MTVDDRAGSAVRRPGFAFDPSTIAGEQITEWLTIGGVACTF